MAVIMGFKLICKRCDWSWVPRGDVLPKVCPHCKSKQWLNERINNSGMRTDLYTNFIKVGIDPKTIAKSNN